MEFLALLGLIKNLMGDIKLLNSFFNDGEIVSILQEIGKIDYKTAIWALKDLRKSNKPSREINEAIFHLRSACSKYKESSEKKRWFGIKATLETRLQGYEMASKTSVLIALCYLYLEESKLAFDHFKNAKNYFELYANAEIEATEIDQRQRLAVIRASVYPMRTEIEETMDIVENAKSKINKERKELERLIDMTN